MRWYWIDRFLEFDSGRSAKAVKNISLAEEHLHDHFPGFPVMPNSLIIEGFAQCGGLLVGEHLHYSGTMILAKVPKARFLFPAVPGQTLVYETRLESIEDDGAMLAATCHAGDRLQAEAEVFFANVAAGPQARKLFDARELVAMMKLLGAYEVGRAADGSRLQPPTLEN